MTSAVPLHASPVPAPLTEVEDRRLVVVRDLVSDDWLPGEWDAESMVLIPRADSLLARQRACVVLECGAAATGGTRACVPSISASSTTRVQLPWRSGLVQPGRFRVVVA